MTHKSITIQLRESEFTKAIAAEGGVVFLVGGIVRDKLLDKISKDIDLLVTGIPMNKLVWLLSRFGKVDTVGVSFGVIKFRPNDMELDEPIDIALPRTEVSIGNGHKSFEIVSNENITVEADLKRRDFTINTFALRLSDMALIDPFGGLQDILNKEIKMVDEVAFTDDPLRMLRAVQFASRFGFDIESNTLQAIKDKASTIKFISSERILIELEKIRTKGDIKLGFKLLVETGLFKVIFGIDEDFSNVCFDDIKTKGDFFFTLLRSFTNKPEVFRCMTGDNDTAKEIEAIQFGFNNASIFVKTNRVTAVKMFKISKSSFDTSILPNALLQAIQELKDGKFPKTLKELKIDGNDLIGLGFKGKEIGDMLEFLMVEVLFENLPNNRDVLFHAATDES